MGATIRISRNDGRNIPTVETSEPQKPATTSMIAHSSHCERAQNLDGRPSDGASAMPAHKLRQARLELVYLGSGAGLALVATGGRSLDLGRSEAPLRARPLLAWRNCAVRRYSRPGRADVGADADVRLDRSPLAQY